MKTTLLNRMGSFVLGGGTGVTVALTGLALWTGTTDLGTIKTSVQQYVMQSEQQVGALLGEYNVTVDSANAEIGEYKVALQQANSNIDKLITAYNNAETEHQTEVSNLQKTHEEELKQAQTSAENDLKELQTKLAEMETRLDSQYATDMNKVVEEANKQINKANEDVAKTKEQVDGIIGGSIMSDIAQNGERHKLNTTGDKSVKDISSIVPTEQQGK